MGMFGQSVAHGLRNLTNFSGRDRPGIFWPYAGLVVGTAYVLSFLFTLPAMMRLMQASLTTMVKDMERARSGEDLDLAALQAELLFGEFAETMRSILLPSAVLTVLAVLLLAAAVARRLHDRDRTGWWGLLPLPFWMVGFVLVFRFMETLEGFLAGVAPDPGFFFLVMALNLAQLAALAFLVYHLASRGTTGPNRYGEEPLAPSARA